MEKRQPKGFNLYNVSLARNWLYALSILMIVFFHCGLKFSNTVINVIKVNCNFAVEIFFILSGISLYFSYSKDENPVQFLKRRLKRLLPYYCVFYFLIFFLKNILQNFNLSQFLLNFSTLDFWLNGLGNVPWFLCGILVIYLAYPLLYNLFFKEYKNKKYYLLVAIVSICFCSYFLIKLLPHLTIFFCRIPSVLIGVSLGKSVAERKTVKWSTIACLFVAFLLSIYLREIGQRLLFNVIYQNLLALILILLFTWIYNFNKRFIPFVNKIEFIGGFTFEIYMTHEKTQELLYEFLMSTNLLSFEYSSPLYQISAIILALIISVGLGKLINFAYKKLEEAFCKKRKSGNFISINDEAKP